jgi:LPS export ABC transporter permease LptF
MKIIDRYIIKEVAMVSLVGFFIFTFLLVMNSLFVMSDLVIKYGISIIKVTELLFLLLPSTVAVTVPMAFLVGILLTYSRLVQDNEFHGMQASGISIASITMPAVYLSLIVTVGMVLFNNYALPYSNLNYKKLYFDIVKKRSSIIIQEHTFINDFDNYIFYIGGKGSKNDSLKDIIVFVKNSGDINQPAKVILSREGEIISDEKSLRLALKLKKGTIQLSSYTDPNQLSQILYDTNYVDLDIQGILRSKSSPDDLKSTREMTGEELLAEMKKGKDSRQDRNWLNIELQKKLSIPFAVLAFALAGIPMGLMTKKGGRIMGSALSLVLIFIYYILLSIGQNYGYNGKMDYFFAVWMPNIFLALCGLSIFAYMLIQPAIKKRARL